MTPTVQVRGVEVTLGGRPVLDGVDLEIGEGEFTGLIGANGAGKTTLLRTILGLVTPDRGEVLVAGRSRSRRNRLVGYVPQKIHLDPDMPMRVRDLVGLGLDGHRLGPPRRSAGRDEAVARALAAVGADHLAGARVGRLSGGEQQRAMIAHALIGRPRLLLLDEPLANLDISSTDDIVAVLDRIRNEHGVSILLSAHDMNPLLAYMDRVAYMAEGRVASGPTAQVVRTEVLSELYRHPVEVIRVRGRVLVVSGP